MAYISIRQILKLQAIIAKEHNLKAYFGCAFVFAQLAVFRAFELQFEYLRRIAYKE